MITRTASKAFPVSTNNHPCSRGSTCFPIRCPSFVCQSNKLVDLRTCSGVISRVNVVINLSLQRIHHVVAWSVSRALLSASSVSLREAAG